MILEKSNYGKNALRGKTILLTGGGGGIGYEAARAFSFMGAKIIAAEIDADRGAEVAKLANVDFYQIDISDEKQIEGLHEYIMDRHGQLDVIINNAAVVPMGAIDQVTIADWDLSYAVNLRAPVLLIQKFLPAMQKSGGIIVFNPSAPVAPYMSAYEIFKTAQVELCRTLPEELSDDSVIVYSVVPGFVKTHTAIKAVETVASSMGISVDDFYESQAEVIVDAEIAGVGYAVSVLNARKYHGKETLSYQVLVDCGLLQGETEKQGANNADIDKLRPLLTSIADVFYDQYDGCQKKNLFQRQFIQSDFKKQMGLSAQSFKEQLEALQSHHWADFPKNRDMFVKLQHFYEHQKALLQGYEKNAAQLERDTALLNHWIEILQKIIDGL